MNIYIHIYMYICKSVCIIHTARDRLLVLEASSGSSLSTPTPPARVEASVLRPPPLNSDVVFQETSARFRVVELGSCSNIIPRRPRPDLAGVRPHTPTHTARDRLLVLDASSGNNLSTPIPSARVEALVLRPPSPT